MPINPSHHTLFLSIMVQISILWHKFDVVAAIMIFKPFGPLLYFNSTQTAFHVSTQS